MSYDILIVDDEEDIRIQIAGILEDEGYSTREAGNSRAAQEAVAARQPSLVILDVWLSESELDGLELLDTIKRDHPTIPVVMISGHGTFDMAVSATKKGAYDFISKPFKSDVLLHTIERALDEAKLRRENADLRRMTGGGPVDLVGRSAAMQDVRKVIERIAGTESRALIIGPAGSGKSVVARQIHAQSQRAKGPFVTLNCACLDPEVFEETLFGKESSAQSPRRVGVLEEAHGGTLFLDEVADMPKETQSKLVRVLHAQRFQRVGGSNFVEVNVRVLSSTAKDLTALISEGAFREDLYYRLNVVPIIVPPLTERREDIADLARQMMERSASARGRTPRKFGEDAIAVLQGHEWPGNAWELLNVVERLLLLGGEQGGTAEIGAEAVVRALGESSAESLGLTRMPEVMNKSLREAREAFEREYLMFHLTRFGGNISRTAEFVGMDRAALHRKLKGLGLQNDARG